MSKKKNPSKEVTILDDIISNQNEKMRSQVDMINFLKQQLEVAYDVNQRLQEELESKSDNMDDKSESNFRNLTQLSTLLMVLMNLIIPHCDDSSLGQAIGKAIKRYQIIMAKSLVKDTVYIKEEHKEDWKEEDGDEYGEEEF